MHTQIRNIEWKTAAKMLDIGPVVLRRKLVEADIFSKGKPSLPHTKYIHMGYFDTELTKFKTGDVDHWTTKALVTAKGIAFLREFLNQQPPPQPHAASTNVVRFSFKHQCKR